MSSATQHYLQETIVHVLLESLTTSLEERAKLITKLYGTFKATPEETKRKILNFANDVVFFRPVLAYAHLWQGDAFIYFFNEPNTWEGPWEGFATHILDISYLFQNFDDHLTGAQRNVAIQFATDVITFANGNALFPPFGFQMTELYSRVYGGSRPEDSGTVTTVNGPSSRTERRSILFDIVDKVPGDELSDAWTAFLAGH